VTHAIHTNTLCPELDLEGCTSCRIEVTKKKEGERERDKEGYVNARIGGGEDSGFVPCNYLVFGPVNVQKEGVVVFLIE